MKELSKGGQGKSDEGSFLTQVSPVDRTIYAASFRRARFLRPFYNAGMQEIFGTLDQMGVSAEVKGALLTRVARAHIDLPYHPEYITFFSQMNVILQSLRDKTLPFDETAATLLVGSARQEDLFLRTPNYSAKVLRAIAAYAAGSCSEPSTISGIPDVAIPLTEEEKGSIGSSLIKAISKNITELEVSAKSGVIVVQEKDRHSESFAQILLSEKGVEYAHIGNLFFVNVVHRDALSSSVARLGNVIFVTDVKKSELSSSLGYYTINTLSSLMKEDLRDKVVLDCGTGTGLLAIAAKRLGAKGVIAVDINPEKIKVANRNKDINGYAEDSSVVMVEGDLTQPLQVIPHVATFPPSAAVLISNIGSWGDYAITNTSVYSYIPLLQELPGWSVASVTSGGYNDLPTRIITSEASFLRRIGFSLPKKGKKAEEWDMQVLKRLGFSPKARAVSEELRQRGYSTHKASSFLVIAT